VILSYFAKNLFQIFVYHVVLLYFVHYDHYSLIIVVLKNLFQIFIYHEVLQYLVHDDHYLLIIVVLRNQVLSVMLQLSFMYFLLPILILNLLMLAHDDHFRNYIYHEVLQFLVHDDHYLLIIVVLKYPFQIFVYREVLQYLAHDDLYLLIIALLKNQFLSVMLQMSFMHFLLPILILNLLMLAHDDHFLIYIYHEVLQFLVHDDHYLFLIVVLKNLFQNFIYHEVLQYLAHDDLYLLIIDVLKNQFLSVLLLGLLFMHFLLPILILNLRMLVHYDHFLIYVKIHVVILVELVITKDPYIDHEYNLNYDVVFLVVVYENHLYLN